MIRLRDDLDAMSRIKYAIWRASKFRSATRVRLRSHGPVLTLRPHPTKDLDIAREVFSCNVYAPPDKARSRLADCRFVVDVGANVGYSVLYWAWQFTDARIIAYEPHPIHVELARAQLRANDLESRVVLRPVAAGGSARYLNLSDQGPESTLTAEVAANAATIRVEVVDWFHDLKANSPTNALRIDLLKIDIEGGEYELLCDPRFDLLDVGVVVLEWHANDARPDGYVYCRRRLEGLGFTVSDGAFKYDKTGILWGWR